MQGFEKAWNKLNVAKQNDGLIGTPAIDRRFHVIKGSSHKLAIMLNDIHFPYEDKRMLKKAMNVVKDMQPDHVLLNGDIIDFYTISSFSKDPSRSLSIQDELNRTKDFLRELREACPDARISYTIGNHEDRLRRYLRSNAAVLERLDALKLESLLGLSDFDIRLYGAEGFKLNRETVVTHGARTSKHTGGTARMEFERHLSSGLSGHCHRAGRYDVVGHSKSFFWVEGGCLCELDPEYIDGKPNWQHAITLVEYTNDRTHAELCQAHDGRLVVRGVEY